MKDGGVEKISEDILINAATDPLMVCAIAKSLSLE